MTIGAYDIAFPDFREEPRPGHQHRGTSCQSEDLVRWISVMEVHLVRFERLATVGAWAPPQISEQGERHILARAYSRNLGFSVPPVVGNIGRPLTRSYPHGLL